MAGRKLETGRGSVGYGSTYGRGRGGETADGSSVAAVLKGQVWLIKPDREAQAANPCIWMQAGAVAFKNCGNFYDCTSCKYDFGMRKKVKKGAQVSWQDAMRRRKGLARTCRHSLTRRIGERACAYDYLCHKCDFDQLFEDTLSAKTASLVNEVHDVAGFMVPAGYYFNDGHTWARIESGGYVRIGMDDFALKLFGKADSYDFPVIGKELTQGGPGWRFRRSEREGKALSPVSGIVVEANARLTDEPAAANRKPYEDGWMLLLRAPDIKATVRNLMSDGEGLAWMDREADRLNRMIEETAGPLAADGGHLGEDIYGNLPGLGWDRLAREFLRT